MDGAIKLSLGEEICRGFLGFGVAITGSSCYELNTMPKEARTALLSRNIKKERFCLIEGSNDPVPFDLQSHIYCNTTLDKDRSLCSKL